MRRARQWFGRNLDVIAFGVALASVGPLMAWWAVLVRRNIMVVDRHLREQIEYGLTGDARAHQLAELDAATNRQLFMIFGESTLAGVLLCVLAIVLFMVARQRRNETRRLQTMLQLTTHQLKTPLAGMRVLLQSLQSGAIPAELRPKFLSQGLAECDRLEHLVESTLAYQRAVAQVNARHEVVPSESLVSSILQHRKATFPDDAVAWQPAAQVPVACDPDAVRVVLENLLDNARKYGGGHVELVEATQGGRWRLEVRDRGQGFEAGEAERLFEPFERGGGKGVAHGSGLGLFISRRLARQMHGELSARSDGPGKGSVFVLELPVAKQQEVGRG
jgi:signal transduction histidine kinase